MTSTSIEIGQAIKMTEFYSKSSAAYFRKQHCS